jgi:hypothetical protein
MRKDKRSESGGTGRMDYYDGKEIFRNLNATHRLYKARLLPGKMLSLSFFGIEMK